MKFACNPILSVATTLFAVCLPVMAEDTSTGILPPQDPKSTSIRVQRPLLVEFGGTYPKLPGLGVTYNLNEHFALGVHGSYLHFLNSFAATGRYYFQPEASTLYAEVDMYLMHASFTSSSGSLSPGAALMLGYEYRSDNGFTMGAGAGIAFSPFGGLFGASVPLQPALSLSFGHAF